MMSQSKYSTGENELIYDVGFLWRLELNSRTIVKKESNIAVFCEILCNSVDMPKVNTS